MSPDVPEACKTFAAQTFRAKVGISLENQDLRHNYKDLRALSALTQQSILSLLATGGPLPYERDLICSSPQGSYFDPNFTHKDINWP